MRRARSFALRLLLPPACLALLLAAPSAALASGLSISTQSGGAGTGATVSGSGFSANASVSIFWLRPGAGDQRLWARLLASATADGTGNLPNTIVTIPGGPSGTYAIVATDGTNYAFTTFNLTTNAPSGATTIAIWPLWGAPGSTVSITGSGFTANQQVNLTVDGSGWTSTTSDGNGNISVSAALPGSLSIASHSIVASDSSGHSATTVIFATSNALIASGGVVPALPPGVMPNLPPGVALPGFPWAGQGDGDSDDRGWGHERGRGPWWAHGDTQGISIHGPWWNSDWSWRGERHD